MKYLLLILLSLNLFALDTVNSGSIISAAKFNELVTALNKDKARRENIHWAEGTTDIENDNLSSYVDIPDMNVSITTDEDSLIEVHFEMVTENISDNGFSRFQLIVDGTVYQNVSYGNYAKGGWEQLANYTRYFHVGAGTHNIKVQWKAAGSKILNSPHQRAEEGHTRYLIVKEIQ